MVKLPQISRAIVVLIANDQEWSARSLDSILSPHGYAVIRAYTGRQALERARAARPDLVILDAQLPDIHGFEVCRELRADPRFGRTTPIIITTAGPSGRTQRLEAYEAGAWEFYGQPLDGEALLTRFDTFLAAKLEADALRDAAMLDATNGLYTIRGLAHRVREIGSEAYRHGRPLTCIALAFSQPEKQDGALQSDGTAAMARLGELLREHGRSSDAIAHLGGQEYLVVAPGTEGDAALKLVGRLEEALRGDGETPPRLAVGYTAVADLRAASLEPAAMLDRATVALRYSLDHPGSNPIVAFEDLPVQAAAG
jgi:PleD family two-component response regulator